MEIMKSFSSPFLLLLVLVLICNAGAIPGGWTPIDDLQDADILDIAKFAIAEHNKQAHANLILTKVVKGESQVVAGSNYRLVLQATDGLGASGVYAAAVWEKPSGKSRQLLSFHQQPAVLDGEWEPISNPSGDPEVRAIAEFAVAEQNKQEKSQLTLGSVVKGEKQVVAGIRYRLTLRARDSSGKEAEYEAVVLAKPSPEKSRQLISFTLLPNQN